MGVINNLIEIRRKFIAIVGNNWDGSTLSDLLDERPHISFDMQPIDTSEDNVTIKVNVYGYVRQLQRLTNGIWMNVGSPTGSSGTTSSQSLAGITETSICRIMVAPYGGNFKKPVYSNEFTVTRPTSQDASATPKNKDADIFTESEVDSIESTE